MHPRSRCNIRWLPFALTLALGGMLLVVGRAPTQEAPPRAKQIAELERQLAELNQRAAEMSKRLAELKNGAAAGTLRPLGLADALSWRSIAGAALSHDGKWLGYRAGPYEGDGEVVLRAIAADKETRWPAGSGFAALAFSHDSKWFAFTVNPPKEKNKGTAPKGPAKKDPAAKPAGKGKVVLVNIATGKTAEFEAVSRFAFSGEAATHLALHRAAGAAAPPPASGGPVAAPAVPPTTGTDLLLHELATGAELNLGNVADFAFDKKGRWLALVIDSPSQSGNGVQLRDMTTAALVPLDTAKASYRSLAWTEKGDGFTVLKGTEDKDYADKRYSIVGFRDLGAKVTKSTFDPRDHKDFPKDMTVSPNRAPNWTEDLSAFVFGIHKLKKKDAKDAAKKDDKKAEAAKGGAAKGGAEGASKDRPDLVIWHWADERLQPMQQVQATADKRFSYLCVYRVAEKRFIRLADETLRQVTPAPHQRWAVALVTKPYQRMSTLDGRRYQDVYVVDMHTGAKRKVLTKNRWYASPSPDGSRFLYYDDGHYFTCDMATGKTVKITEGVPATFVNTEDDHNIVKPPRPALGWTKDSGALLLSDGWDIWRVPVHAGSAVNVTLEAAGGFVGKTVTDKVHGGPAVNLTVDGKRDAIRYGSPTGLDPEAKGFDLAKPLYVMLRGQWTKKAGFGRIDPDKPGVTRLCWDDAAFSRLAKARHADVFVYTRETYKDYPDYCVADTGFKSPRKLTHVNPQQDKTAWCSGVRLIDYKSAKGDKLQAALYLPANYEAGKSYPTIVYIYERLSDRIHNYAPPAASGFSVAMYTSNGYAVLMPDITYRVNDPGMSAVWCVLPALEAAVATGVVDKGRVGLHGHSWGGYQTAFLITQTDAFKAAIAGAPLTNLVSMYSSVYWNTGSANQPIFESSQGRFTGPYWDNLDAYVRNSPVYHAKNVKTPLLLLHNDKDGAVDWNQGIEYFNTLRRLEKPVVMLQYKGENHGVVKPANRKDYTVRMREFFDHHLQGKPAPAWLSQGVPHLELEEHIKERAMQNR